MILTCMILTALATTALAKGSIECSFTDATGAQRCFGAVGQPLVFHIPNSADTEIRLIKDNKWIIIKINKNQTESLHGEYVNQAELFANGTFKLGKAMRRHSGEYLMEEFGPDGALQKKKNLYLEIQAPVSKPAVSQLCLSPEQMTISCSSEGDGVEFGLTLDGVLLMQTSDHSLSSDSRAAKIQSVVHVSDKQDGSAISTVTLDINGYRTGNLMCNVWNNVSRKETVIHLNSCKAPVSKPAVSQECLLPEQMIISCSSEGDGVKFILTLDRPFQMQTRDHSLMPKNRTANMQLMALGSDKQDANSVSNVTISLPSQLTGNLMCHVWNNVSADVHFTDWKGIFSQMPVATAVRAGVITLFLLVSSLCICIVHKKTRPTTIKEDPFKEEISTGL